MGYGDYHWGLYRDYYRDPFPHSLLRTRQQTLNLSTKALTPSISNPRKPPLAVEVYLIRPTSSPSPSAPIV